MDSNFSIVYTTSSGIDLENFKGLVNKNHNLGSILGAGKQKLQPMK